MNFFKRSLTSIKRRKGKSIILFLSILLVCNVLSGAISIKKALKQTENNIKDNIKIEVTPEIDYDKVTDVYPKDITEEQIEKISKSEYVKSYYINYNYNLTSTTLKSTENGGILYKTLLEVDDSISYFNIIGVDTNIKEIDNKKIKIINGSTFKQEEVTNGSNVVIISKELAEKNNLKVGDKIVLNKNITAYLDYEVKTLDSVTNEFTVVGIFEAKINKTVDKDGTIVNENNPLANYIYMPNKKVSNIHDEVLIKENKYNIDQDSDYIVKATFFLNSIEDITDFNNDNLKILPVGYKFNDNSSLYTSSLAPMENMNVVANYIFYASFIAVIIIIGLISLLFFRERKHEIGIYLALGEQKLNIAFQILIETLLISLLAIIISIITGNLLARNISNKMLETQYKYSQIDSEEYYDEYGYKLNYSEDELLSKYNVNLSTDVILLIFIISLGSITLSTLIPIYYTLKINPKKILM